MVRVGILRENNELTRIVGPVAQRVKVERAPKRCCCRRSFDASQRIAIPNAPPTVHWVRLTCPRLEDVDRTLSAQGAKQRPAGNGDGNVQPCGITMHGGGDDARRIDRRNTSREGRTDDHENNAGDLANSSHPLLPGNRRNRSRRRLTATWRAAGATQAGESTLSTHRAEQPPLRRSAERHQSNPPGTPVSGRRLTAAGRDRWGAEPIPGVGAETRDTERAHGERGAAIVAVIRRASSRRVTPCVTIPAPERAVQGRKG